MGKNNLLEVEEDGLVLVTMDGTRWRVSVGEHTRCLTWLPTESVSIEENDDGSYLITRHPQGDAVTARPE